MIDDLILPFYIGPNVLFAQESFVNPIIAASLTSYAFMVLTLDSSVNVE